MKNIILSIVSILVASFGFSQTVVNPTATQNYVHKVNYKKGYLEAQLSTATNDEKIETISYFDGLGRPIQSVGVRQGGKDSNNIDSDVVAPSTYDIFGRQVKAYLPVPNYTNNGRFDTSALDNNEAHYLLKYPSDLDVNEVNAYSEKVFEPSPLNRILEQGAPGEDWLADPNSDDDHTIKFDYQGNIANEVAKYKIIFLTGNTEEPQLYYDNYYDANELYKTVTKDENWDPLQTNLEDHTTNEFKDKQGRVILKRTYNYGLEHDTYYVYDDFGNLTYVLSPSGSDKVLSLNNYVAFTQQNSPIPFINVDKSGNPVVSSSGDVDITLDDINNTLTVDFSIIFSPSTIMVNGPIFLLDETVPDMVLGTITDGSASYIVSIQDNFLNISGTGYIAQVIENFVVNLPTHYTDPVVLDDLGYQYRYDNRNRLIEKKIPGKDWEYIVYDLLDRPRYTQDANLRAQSEWLFTKYDALGRVAYTGKYDQGGTRGSHQGSFANNNVPLHEVRSVNPITISGSTLYYTYQSYPISFISEILSINYYDDYNFDLAGLSIPTQNSYGITLTTNTKSFATGSKIRVLGTSNWITTITGYDHRGRPVYVASYNAYLDTTDIIETNIDDFNGQVTQTTTLHTKGTNLAIVTVDDFTYDHTGRLISQIQTIAGENPELITNNVYDELGQLVSKGVGSIEESPLQTVDYSYNIRGWLKTINDIDDIDDDLFTFKLNYNDKEDINAIPLYNGNISESYWQTSSDDLNSVSSRGYFYTYDALNRIEKANYRNVGGSISNGIFNLSNVLYDKNGNIKTLKRSGINDQNGSMWSMDDLVYDYNGNQLTDVIENGNHSYGFIDVGNIQNVDYTYDNNGNMISDANKDISSITYNHLNLPTVVTTPNGNISYIYDASGVKLKKIVTDNGNLTTTNYAGNFIYEKVGANAEELKFFSHPEGYIEPDGSGGYNYVYQYKDHLGNIRLSYTKDKVNSIIIQEDYTNDTGAWSAPTGVGNVTNTNNELNISITNQWGNIGAYYTIIPGENLHIEFDFEKGTMLDPILSVKERINGVWEDSWERDWFELVDGHFEADLTLTGDYIRVYISKGADTDHGTLTTCMVDNFVLTHDILEIREENNYYPFGLKHKGYNNVINGTDHKYGYNGKEENEELGLAWHDFGFRNYDAALGRWMNIDPLAEKRLWTTPYNFVQNSPLIRIDPNGLTDYKLNKKTGEVTRIGDVNDDPDKLFITRKGKIRTNKRTGKIKNKSIDNVAKGILKNGQNFKTDDNTIDVNASDSEGNNEPTSEQVENFALNLSKKVGKEISGHGFGENGNTSKIVLWKYEDNYADESKSPTVFSVARSNGQTSITGSSRIPSDIRQSLSVTYHFHTHILSRSRLHVGLNVAGVKDKEYRDRMLQSPLLRYNFFIKNNNGKFEYTDNE